MVLPSMVQGGEDARGSESNGASRCNTYSMYLSLLGTGTPVPDPRRAGSGTALMLDSAVSWLQIDCGRGVTQRAATSGLDFALLHAVLLTHHHSDHISDLATLAIARFIAGASTPLRVVVPEGPCRRFAETCLDAFDDQSFFSQRTFGSSERPRIDVETFIATEDLMIILQDEPWTVRSVLVEHHPIKPAVGYRISDGTTTVAISGDTIACGGVAKLAEGADVLVHQALRSDLVSSAALKWNAGARSVGELAVEASVGHLVLTHLMPSPVEADDELAFLDEARSGGYQGPITIPNDLDRLIIPEPTSPPSGWKPVADA
jgi:ribonuclease Z